jgi:hypothetical protein
MNTAYPELKKFQAPMPKPYQYQSSMQQIKTSAPMPIQHQAKQQLKVTQDVTPKKPKTLKDHILEETLEKPSESVAFLEKYHKSALKVKELKEGVSTWGQVLTVVAVFSVSLNAWNLMENTPGNDVSESANPRLTSAATDELVEEIVMADGSLDL